MSPRRERLKALFHDALERSSESRAAFVRAAAGEDEALAEEVLGLIAHHHESELIAQAARGPVDDPLGVVGQRIGPHRVERWVATGGFAFVYRARRDDGRTVALKLLRPDPEASPEALRARVERERATLDALRSPAVVRALDTGLGRDAAGRVHAYVALEWLDGHALGDRPDAARPWSLAELVERLEPIAAALAEAHALGIAHRDVKPANLFVTASGLRLLDFGVAKRAADRRRGFHSTDDALCAASVAWAAPEQIRGAATGPWTDVHGLALVAVELLSGRPTEPQSLLELLLSAVDGQRAARAAALARLDPRARRALGRALSVAVDERPELGDLWSALRGALTPDPGSPVRPSLEPTAP